MSLTTTTYVDVRQRTVELGLGTLPEFAILPRGFATSPTADGLADETEASTLRKLLNEAGIDVRQLRKSDRALPSVVQKTSDWIAPTFFVGSMFWSQNPLAVQLALNVISSYLSDYFKGRSSVATVKLSIVVEKTKAGEYREVNYDGPLAGLTDVAEVVRRVRDEPC